VSAPDPNVLQNNYPSGFQPFKRELFAEFVRCLLASFYTDIEVMVTSFLLDHVDRAAFTDQQIAETLCLSQRQVKAAIESRLVKDSVLEGEYPSGQSAGFSNNSGGWYRLNPNILIATAFRFAKCDKTLRAKLHDSKQSESFVCGRCGRVYDLLRAMSVGGFFCEVCEDVELTAEDNRTLRAKFEDQLTRLHTTLRPLREALQRCEGMYVPRPIVVKRSLQREADEIGKKEEENKGDSVRQFLSRAAWAPQAGQPQKQVTQAPEWLKTEQVVTAAEVAVVSMYQPSTEDIRQTAAKLLRASHSSPDLSALIKQTAPKKEEAEEEAQVQVAGVNYSLREVRANDSLVDRMSDEEFERYDALLQQRLKMQPR